MLGVAKIFYRKADFLVMEINEVKSQIKMHSMSSASSGLSALTASSSTSSTLAAGHNTAAAGPLSVSMTVSKAPHTATLQAITLPESHAYDLDFMMGGDNLPDLIPGESTRFFFDQESSQLQPIDSSMGGLEASQVEEVQV